MTTVRLAVLGPLQIHRNDELIELNIAKLQALLGYLAVTRTAHSREQLLGLLWAESHADAARKNLRNRLWQLRQLLGEDVVVATGDSLALADSVSSDVANFEQVVNESLQSKEVNSKLLGAALDLWRGPLLDGLQLSEAPDFELWLTTERERLGQLYRRGMEALIAERQQQYDWPQVIALAQQSLRHDPLQETLHQALMRAYHEQGQRTEALRQYETLRTLLKQELDVEPMAETTSLYQSIRNHGSRITDHESSTHSPMLTRGVLTSTLRTSTFIGREPQLAALDLAFTQASQGFCKVVVLSGEMGIGKSRLWQKWMSRLPAPQVVLETRCLNTTQTVPFDPLRRLLDSPPSRAHFSRVGSQLLPVWQRELIHLAPALQPDRALHEAATLLPPSEERTQIAEALTQFMHSFSASPLVLFIDDLHWADEATLNWLLYFSDRMLHEPLLLVAAYRSEDAPASLVRILAQWQREGLLQRLPVPKFTAQETANLLHALGSNTDMVDYLYTQSGGNPYYLTQLSDVAVDGVPATLAELIQARLRYLPESTQSTLQAAALLEPNIDLFTLRHTSQRSEDETLDALDLLLTNGILQEQSERYEFTHPLVATVVRDGLSNGRRKLYHRRAAEGIADRYRDQLSLVAGELARHYGEAGERIESARFAEIAGEEALQIGASEEALRFFQQANAVESTPARQLGIGLALLFLPGKLSEARVAMQQALEQSEAAGDCRGTIKAGLRLAGSYISEQDGAQVLYWTRRVLPDLETVDDPELQASAHYLMGTAKFRNGYSMSEAAAHYAEATRLSKEKQFESEIELMSWFEWGNLHLHQGDYALAVEKFQKARQLAHSGRSILFEALSLNNLAYANLLKGDLEAAKAAIQTGIAHAERYALLAPRQYLFSTSGEIALAQGRISAAEESFQQALAYAEKYANPTFAANVHAHLGRTALAKGDWNTAFTQFTTAQAALQGDATHHLQGQIALWLTELHLQRGETEAAQASLQTAETIATKGQYAGLLEQAAHLRVKLGDSKTVKQ
ncbi:MAG: BTAD domain-containing putative transcriptional regulator [Caldilineaceae bacterium]